MQPELSTLKHYLKVVPFHHQVPGREQRVLLLRAEEMWQGKIK
jgi:hypothetical protein